MTSRWFPLPTPRPSQTRALDAIADAWSRGIGTVVMQLPVGVGKSPLALAASRLSAEIPLPGDEDDEQQDGEDTWVLTTQKVLQDQYIREFGDMLVNIKGKSNYPCLLTDGEENCERGSRIAEPLGEDVSQALTRVSGRHDKRLSGWLGRLVERGEPRVPCKCSDLCPYRVAFGKWIQAPVSITNLAYFMNCSQIPGYRWQRDLLVVDEAHVFDEEIVRFFEIGLPGKWIDDNLGLHVPEFDDLGAMRAWIHNHLLPALRCAFGRMRDAALMARTREQADLLHRQLERAQRLEQRATGFLKLQAEDWVLCREQDGQQVARPLHTGRFGMQAALFGGQRRLLMSGTILDPEQYCLNIGLDPDRVAYYEEGSPFNPAKRPVYGCFVGSMGRRCQEQTLPRMLAAVRQLLDHHPRDKGIIHTGSYRINQAIIQGVNSPRLMAHMDAAERSAALERHYESDEPTVLVSPSMATGIDLRDDKARWGAIVKVPYPYLGDNRIARLAKEEPRWYAWKTVQSIIQQCGRIVRSADDWGVMYILDSDFNRLYGDNRSMFPDWWREAYREIEQ